jgi:hypothetical protein
MIADSWIELQQFRLLVLKTAWKIDKANDNRRVATDIALAETETDLRAALALVQDAIRIDPYGEDLYQRAMRLHATLGSADGVRRTLVTITERLVHGHGCPNIRRAVGVHVVAKHERAVEAGEPVGDPAPQRSSAVNGPISAPAPSTTIRWSDRSSHCGLSATSRTASAHEGSTTPAATQLSSWRLRSAPRSR